MSSPSIDPFFALRKYETAPGDTVIRRYLTAEKFERFLNGWELRFAPASAFLDDPEEGFFTLRDQAVWEDRLKKMRFPERGMNHARQAWDTISKHNAGTVVISCWAQGQEESRLMWTEYGKSSRAVAIETTLGALRAVLGIDVIAAPVRYIDRERTKLPETHSVEPFLYKGLDFEWENELRFIANMEMGQRIGTPRMFRLSPDTLPVKFILAPGADRQRRFEVLELLGQHAPKVEVRRSTLWGLCHPLCSIGVHHWCACCRRKAAHATGP